MNSTLVSSTILGLLMNPNTPISLSPFIVSVIVSVGTASEGVHTRMRKFLEPKLPVKLSVNSNKIEQYKINYITSPICIAANFSRDTGHTHQPHPQHDVINNYNVL